MCFALWAKDRMRVKYGQGFWWGWSADFCELPLTQSLGTWRMLPDSIVIVLGAFQLLFFLLSTFPRLRKVGEKELPVAEI
jgi:hypothetical protein